MLFISKMIEVIMQHFILVFKHNIYEFILTYIYINNIYINKCICLWYWNVMYEFIDGKLLEWTRFAVVYIQHIHVNIYWYIHTCAYIHIRISIVDYNSWWDINMDWICCCIYTTYSYQYTWIYTYIYMHILINASFHYYYYIIYHYSRWNIRMGWVCCGLLVPTRGGLRILYLL
jgi:hypothetical protein